MALDLQSRSDSADDRCTSDIRSPLRQEVRDALKDAEPVKELQHQVHDALKHVGEIGELRQQMQAAQRELNIQFQRIVQIQAQLDKLLAILTSPQPRHDDT